MGRYLFSLIILFTLTLTGYAGNNSVVFNDLEFVSEQQDTIATKSVKVDAYPNPMQTTLNIDIEDRMIGGKLRIYNAIGNIVINVDIEENKFEIDVSALRKGIYFLMVEKDKRKRVLRLIK